MYGCGWVWVCSVHCRVDTPVDAEQYTTLFTAREHTCLILGPLSYIWQHYRELGSICCAGPMNKMMMTPLLKCLATFKRSRPVKIWFARLLLNIAFEIWVAVEQQDVKFCTARVTRDTRWLSKDTCRMRLAYVFHLHLTIVPMAHRGVLYQTREEHARLLVLHSGHCSYVDSIKSNATQIEYWRCLLTKPLVMLHLSHCSMHFHTHTYTVNLVSDALRSSTHHLWFSYCLPFHLHSFSFPPNTVHATFLCSKLASPLSSPSFLQLTSCQLLISITTRTPSPSHAMWQSWCTDDVWPLFWPKNYLDESGSLSIYLIY